MNNKLDKNKIKLYILNDILKERNFQDKKWGSQKYSMELWYAILGEEFGEVGKAILEYKTDIDLEVKDDIRDELIQVAAVAMAMIEQIDSDEEMENNDDTN